MPRLTSRVCPQTYRVFGSVLPLALLALGPAPRGAEPAPAVDRAKEFETTVVPALRQYCLDCHSTKLKKGHLDLERFRSVDRVRKDPKAWQGVAEMLEAGEMPPKERPQPGAAERKRVVAWVRGFLDAEARTRAGDPGDVPLRRLSNTEYNRTVRDLTGVDLEPAREFPADGAAGEGFTNAAEALADMSPLLLNKYLAAAKEIAAHAVLLPDGFRFSPGKTRQDWSDETLARLRAFFAEHAPDGRLPLRPYLAATLRHRERLRHGDRELAEVARQEKLSPKYLTTLWQTLTQEGAGYPLSRLQQQWRESSERDVDRLVSEVVGWQNALWQFVKIGSYANGHTTRQIPNDPAVAETQTLRFAVKPNPGQSEVTLHLVARDLAGGAKGRVVWQRPRFEGPGQPTLLLGDYASFGRRYEISFPTTFADTPAYLAAALDAAQHPARSNEEVARQRGLNAALLARWTETLAIDPTPARENAVGGPRRPVPTVPLDLLAEQNPKNPQKPAINGWRSEGAELPILLANSSGQQERIPGNMNPHRVAVHPTPTRFVAAVWNSPVDGRVRVSGQVVHAHPGCGNGVAWWVEYRQPKQAWVLAEGLIDVGRDTKLPSRTIQVARGDQLVLAVDARDGNHACDLTEINLAVASIDQPAQTWDLSADVADNVLAGNPHPDRLGNKDVWRFAAGPTRPVNKPGAAGPTIPPGSVLARWREAATEPARRDEADKLAEQARALLSGPRPAAEGSPDRLLYENLVSVTGPLFQGLDFNSLKKPVSTQPAFGLPADRFDRHGDVASLTVATDSPLAVRLPAALFREREFVVEARLEMADGDRVVRCAVLTGPVIPDADWDGKQPLMGTPGGTAHRKLLESLAAFRRCFPVFVCYPRVIPDDEVVCLKQFHREDEPLSRLLLDEADSKRLDRLWEEHRFVSQFPVSEYKYLPLFIGFVTQDQSKEMLRYFEGLREPFRKRAEAFEREVQAAEPRQLEALIAFADKAYRRPLSASEQTELRSLYERLRKKGIGHDEAVRTTLARLLVAPSFLYHVERSPAGVKPQPVSPWEQASRLSYFLWSTAPDDELRALAAEGRLGDPEVLGRQATRMLKDGRVRALAEEFGTQWIHVRGFDRLNEKNEKLFPGFTPELRKAIAQESVLFFQDLFQSDRPVTDLLDADYTFLNETLARHYGIPGVVGPQWRRVEGVRKFGRGGVLGLASVQAKESGASRTSPVLRGNWVVETLLGEKLPRPPANVPRLPEEEGGTDGLTMRQLVEKHTRVAACAVCHQRIDPFGFALEKYDPIGRLREKDLAGLAVDARVRLKDGTEFDGIDGLRQYLLTRKRDVIVRLFCRKLLGYALGRSVSLADEKLIDETVTALHNNGGRLSAAVATVVRSPQFRTIRGADFAAAGSDKPNEEQP